MIRKRCMCHGCHHGVHYINVEDQGAAVSRPARLPLTPTGPRYQHDCDRCTFVARVAKYDLYTCPEALGTTYLARYGDEGSHYASRCDFRDEVQAQMLRECDYSLVGPERARIMVAVELAFRLLPSLLTNLVEYETTDAGTAPAEE